MTEERYIRSIEQALELVDEWAEAYAALKRDYLRLQHRCDEAEFWAEHHQFMRRHLDPFLPPAMQGRAARVAEPKVYAAIAEHLREPVRVSRFDEPEEVTADPFA
jgi:hypothetical protein